MNKFVATVLAVAVLAACTSNDKKSNKIPPVTSKETAIKEGTSSRGAANFKLDYFKKVPDTIDGCSEVITYDTIPFTKEKYIFVSDFADLAIISVNGKNIYLTRDAVASKQINDKNHIDVYKGQGYRVILTLRETKAIDESVFYEGTMQIFSDRIFVMIKVHGGGGC